MQNADPAPEQQPAWNPSDKAASLRAWVDFLTLKAKEYFERDKTHGSMIFLFADTGIAGVNLVPPNVPQEGVADGIRNAVAEHKLYAAIHISEAWAYFGKSGKDHTLHQLRDGEMNVSDLHDGDKTEALMLRMESRDGACITWLAEIVREGDQVKLGREATFKRESRSDGRPGWFEPPEA